MPPLSRVHGEGMANQLGGGGKGFPLPQSTLFILRQAERTFGTLGSTALRNLRGPGQPGAGFAWKRVR